MQHERDKKRVRQIGEIFTPRRVCREMLSILEKENFGDIGVAFFEPCCGTGNFLVEIINRQLTAFEKVSMAENKKENFKHHFFAAFNTLHNLFAIDVSNANVTYSRRRVRKQVINYLLKKEKVSLKAFLEKYSQNISPMLAIIDYHITQNELLTALKECPKEAEKESKKTKISKKWFDEGRHKFLDFEDTFYISPNKNGGRIKKEKLELVAKKNELLDRAVAFLKNNRRGLRVL